jgi:hypothetical protein
MNHKPKTEIKFGFKSLNRPTPAWARIVFGVCLLITTVMATWVAGTTQLTDGQKFEWVLVLKCIDPFLYGLSRLVGVDLVVKP